MHDFSTLDACKTSILAILAQPKGQDPSGLDYLLANQWGGYRFAFQDIMRLMGGEQFVLIPNFPGCKAELLDKAARQLLEEGKIVQYNYAPSFKGVSMQVVAGLANREADFFPMRAA